MGSHNFTFSKGTLIKDNKIDSGIITNAKQSQSEEELS